MSDFEQANIRAFISNYPAYKVNKGVFFKSAILFPTTVAIITACFGVAANVTKIVILPISSLLFVWGLLFCMRKEIERTVAEFQLYIGCTNLFHSMVLLIAAFKFFFMVIYVPPAAIVFVIITYIVTITLVAMTIIKKVKIGSFKNETVMNSKQTITATTVAGTMVISLRLLLHDVHVDQYVAHTTVSFLLVLMAFLLIFRVEHLIRYYYSQRLQRQL